MGTEKSKPVLCRVELCDRPAYVKGLCKGHYYRLQTTGSPGETAVAPRTPPRRAFQIVRIACSVDGCERIAHSLGYCEMHYGRFRKHGHPGPVGKMGPGKHFWMYREG